MGYCESSVGYSYGWIKKGGYVAFVNHFYVIRNWAKYSDARARLVQHPARPNVRHVGVHPERKTPARGGTRTQLKIEAHCVVPTVLTGTRGCTLEQIEL
jgi:hypothetical protein